MLLFIYSLSVYSLKVTINGNAFEATSFEEILESYGSDINTISSIIVQEGYFQVNSLSNQYKSLSLLEVPAESFNESIDSELFSNLDLLKTVIIDGAISIGSKCFEGCTQLETIQFSLCTIIESNAFQLCPLLKNVQFPKVQIIMDYAFSGSIISSIELNSLIEIGNYGFSDCTLLSTITAPNLSIIGSYCFKGTSLTSITFNNVIQIGSAGHCFESCQKLEVVQLDNVDTLPVYLFYNCPLLHTVLGEKVTTIQDYCFANCLNLATATFPSLLTIGNNAFSGIIALEEVNYPNVTTIGSSAYYGCTGITTVVLNSCHSIGANAFNGCFSLSRIVAPELKSISYAAFRSTAPETLEFPNLDVLYVGTVDGTSNVGGQFMNCSKLKSFTAHLAPLLTVWMFRGCESLSSLNMDNAQSIGTNSLKGCIALTALILPNVKAIASNLFNGNEYIIHFELDSVLTIGYNAFQNSKSIESVSFKSCTSVGEYAFDGCHKLESISMPNVKQLYGRAFSYTSLRKVELNSLSVVYTVKYNNEYHGAQFEGCSALTHVTMKILSYVQNEMFYNCHQLVYVDMPSLKNIYYRGFYLCNSLNNLTFPQLISIGNEAFREIGGLTEIDLPSVTVINQYAFYYCKNLVSFSSENCSTINMYAFDHCSKLKNIYFPKLRELGARTFSYTNLSSIELNSLVFTDTDRYNTEDHGAQFWCCRELTNVTMKMIPYIEIEMFVKCDKLSYIDIPNVNLIYKKAFLECESLNNLTLPRLKRIQEYAFQKVSGLINVDLPSVTNIDQYAFESCPNIRSFSSENCTFIGNYAFNNCPKLEYIYLPNLRELGARAFSFNNFTSIELNALVSLYTDRYDMKDHGNQFQGCCTLTNVTMKAISTISYEMFYYCVKLTVINLPNVYEIKDNAFMKCPLLSNLNLPNIHTIGPSAFQSLQGIVEVDLSSLVTISEYAFSNCDNLISFYAPNCTSVGSYAFRGCSKLSDIHLENVTTIYSYAFYFCEKLESINVPKLYDLYSNAFAYTRLKEVEFNSLSIARTDRYDNANHGCQFQGCKFLTHVTMKAMSYVQNEMFLNCNQLIYVDMPNLVNINYRGFYGCNLLNNISFPNLNIIGEDAFRENPGLIEVNLPSVTNINQYAFYKCHNLLSFSSENCSYIFPYAFYDCGKLEHIYFPKLRELGARSFAYTNLTSIQLDSLVQAGTIRYDLADHGVQFQYCRALKYVSMKSIAYLQIEMFYYCTSLVEINLPSCIQFNSYCLSGCTALKKVTLGHQSIQFGSIPSPNLLTHISFPNAKNVPENTFLDFKEMISCKLPLVSTIESSAFRGCLNLVDLELPSLIEINGDYNFYNCENLGSLSLRSLVNVNSTSANIFQGCRGLKYISLPDRPPKTFNRETFKDMTCKIYIPSESIEIYDNDDSIDGDEKGDHKWCGIELVDFDMIKVIADEQTGIGATLFEACNAAGIQIESIINLRIVTGHLTQDEMTSFKDNFVNLVELKIEPSVSIEGDIIPQNFLLNHKNIKIVRIFSSFRIIDESAFQGCTQLTIISCPNAKELRSKCFFGPTSLEILSFELVDTLTGSHFFSNNSMLINIELPNLKTASITGFISQNSPLISSITLPETPPTLNQGKFLFDVNPYLIGISNKAAVEYDAADTVSNDMHFYSLKLKYLLFLVSVDGDRINGISLKSIVPNNANIVEMIEGEITESDFPLPDSITSFTVYENVSIKSIPSNAFAENVNLKSINIMSKTTFNIGEEAFSGCTSLSFVHIDKATSIQGLAFNGCTNLKTVILNDVETIIGNSHFESCFELKSVSLQSLKTVPSSSNRIFLGCVKLSTIKLPSIVPKVFNKDTFSGLQDQLSLVLPKEQDYIIYDQDVSITGDVKNDGLWCGITLPSTIVSIKINQRNNIYNAYKLNDCILASGISESQIKSLEILRGLVNLNMLSETIKNLPYLEILKISASVNRQGEFIDGYFKGLDLVSVTLPSLNTIPCEFFKDCIKLQNIEINDAKIICDSAFKGCISLESISLNVNSIEGDSHFDGCISLITVGLSSLITVDPTAENIFYGCPLTSIYLPKTPPKTFNKNTFIGKKVIIYGLSNDELRNYDANTDTEDDIENDLKWCGIDLVQLYLTVSINEKEPVKCSSLISAAESISISEVTSIEIQQGMVKKTHLNELKTFTSLSRLTITENTVLESSIIEAEQFQDMTSFIHVKIMHNVTLMSNSFKGCTSLLSIEFAEVPLITEGSFRNCSSLNTVIIPRCKELRGNYIFSGCSNLRDIDLSSLLRVDSSGSKIFEGCYQLTMIRLPSNEPLVFHKDTFIDCTDIKLILPQRSDYLKYDDQSHVVDDIKEDEKWCGIKIDSEFLPHFLVYKINNVEYRNRKLSYYYNNEISIQLLADDETGKNTSQLRTLELIGGLVDSSDLKEMINTNPSIIKFEADLGTLTEIARGTFDDCNSLEEIIIHTEIYIPIGALQNLPSLLKLEMDLQQTIRSDELAGDINLQQISFPLLLTIPSYLFMNLNDLKSVKLDTASLMHRECFKNCVSLEQLELKNMKIIDGDSHFEGCSNLRKIDFSSLSTVDTKSSMIFMNCDQLSEMKLGNEPPIQFNDDIFKNAGIVPKIEIPSLNGWKNYISQCTVNPKNNHYIWYGFDTGVERKEGDEQNCPRQSECLCNSDCIYQVTSKYSVENAYSISMTVDVTMSYILMKSVSYSMGPSFSNIFSETYINGEYTVILVPSYIFSFQPYIIQFYSATDTKTLRMLEIYVKKKKITPEMLIGISCGGASIFFIALACLIFYCRQLREDKLNDLYEYSISDDQPNLLGNNNNENDLDKHIEINENANNQSENDDSSMDYWF